jgi:hypothetical protein
MRQHLLKAAALIAGATAFFTLIPIATGPADNLYAIAAVDGQGADNGSQTGSTANPGNTNTNNTNPPTTQPAASTPTPGTGDTKSNPPAPGPGGGSPAIPPTNPPDPSVGGGGVHTNSGSKT